MLGYLSVRHGNVVGLISGDGESTRMLEPAAGEANLERLLRVIDRASTLEAPPSRFSAQLHYLAEHVRRRMLIVAVTDDGGLGSDDDPLLRRLHAQHEVLWVVVADADPTRFDPRADASEVTDGSALPGAVRGGERLQAAYQQALAGRREATDQRLRRLGIARARVGGTSEVVGSMFALLERQRRRAR